MANDPTKEHGQTITRYLRFIFYGLLAIAWIASAVAAYLYHRPTQELKAQGDLYETQLENFQSHKKLLFSKLVENADLDAERIRLENQLDCFLLWPRELDELPELGGDRIISWGIVPQLVPIREIRLSETILGVKIFTYLPKGNHTLVVKHEEVSVSGIASTEEVPEPVKVSLTGGTAFEITYALESDNLEQVLPDHRAFHCPNPESTRLKVTRSENGTESVIFEKTYSVAGEPDFASHRKWVEPVDQRSHDRLDLPYHARNVFYQYSPEVERTRPMNQGGIWDSGQLELQIVPPFKYGLTWGKGAKSMREIKVSFELVSDVPYGLDPIDVAKMPSNFYQTDLEPFGDTSEFRIKDSYFEKVTKPLR